MRKEMQRAMKVVGDLRKLKKDKLGTK